MPQISAPLDQSLDDCLESAKTADNEPKFQNLIEALPDAIVVHREGRIVFVNPFAVALHGAKTPDDLLGHKISEFIQPQYLPAVEERAKNCYASGRAASPMETVLLACDGSQVDVEAVAIPLQWNGAPAIEVVLRDIRKRKQALASADAWQKRLELAQKAGLQIGLWDWDLGANTLTWSAETYRQFGYSRSSFSGHVEDFLGRLHPSDRPRIEAAIQRVLDGETDEYAEQYRVVHPDGTIFWIDAQGVLVRNGAAHMIGIGVDITDLKKIEQSLREGEEKYRKLFENAMYGVLLARPDGTLLDANPALVEMLGYPSLDELLTRNLGRDIYEDPSRRTSIIAKAVVDKCIETVETNWCRRDGKTFPVRMNGAAILAEDGTVSHFEVIVEDITQRRRLEEQYRQSQKMEAVGLLAGGISHDFSNLLGVILGNTDLLLEKLEPGSEQHHLEAIKKAGTSAAKLVRQLLAFSRKQVLYPTILDLNAVVIDVGKILQRLIGEDVRIVTDLDARIGAVRADRGQIEQILMNMATNARDAMPSGGMLTIKTGNSSLGPDDVSRFPYVKEGPYVHLAVSDNGVGMSEEVRTRIFEPFFTTKDKGRGTGLGLATVYGIVKQSGGYIWVSSTPGAGSAFDIYLPRVAEKSAPDIAHLHIQTEYPKGTETVLVLEDEHSLRQVTCEFLSASGYTVLQAGRPDAAIELASQYKGSISLIISDVVLPEMSGPAAVSKLQALHPEMKALYVSGYVEVPIAQQLVADGAVLLQKPVLRMELLNKVDQMLHPRESDPSMLQDSLPG
jgi:two-component system cell cycle sensor histidine kinase/response regulator CckA